jgi:hypothetical protein
MTPTSAQALTHARSVAPYLPFPLEYPRIRNTYAEAEPDTLRQYKLHGPHGAPYPSYVIVIDRGLLGQYYDVEGTTWSNPPLLSKPSQTVQIGPRSYSLYYDGEQITTVAWHEAGATYWVQNTLINSVSPREMIEIAEETQPLDRAVTRAPLRRARSAQAALAIPNASSQSNSRYQKIAVPIGIVSLIALVLLSVMVVRRRREMKLLREQIGAQVSALEAHARRQRAMF